METGMEQESAGVGDSCKRECIYISKKDRDTQRERERKRQRECIRENA